MAYTTKALVKTYLGITVADDDDLIDALIDRATADIESYTGRCFEAATATHYFRREAIDGRYLWLDGDLVSVSTLTNGDSASTVIAATDYTLYPRNYGPPYHRIRMDTDSDDPWQVDTDCWISVAGDWGYSATPPNDIVHAVIRLVGYYYRQRDAQVFDVTAMPDQGALLVPAGIPADVRRILDTYKRHGDFARFEGEY